MKRMQLTGIALLLMTGIPVISMAQDKVEVRHWSRSCKRIHLAWTGFRKCEHPTLCFRILQRFLPFGLGFCRTG